MRREELITQGALYFDRIEQGMEQYEWQRICAPAQKAELLLAENWKKNSGKAFLDFYYFSLEDADRKKLQTALSEEEIQWLQEKERELMKNPAFEPEKDLFFPLEERLLKIAVRLNEAEMLFSTFYFTGEKSTWWGNYGKEYVVFRERESGKRR